MCSDFRYLTKVVLDDLNQSGCVNVVKHDYITCFNKLEQHLCDLGIEYSIEESEKWLDSLRGQMSNCKFNAYRAAINKLNDLCFYGEIHKGHGKFTARMLKLCEEFKPLYFDLLEQLSELAPATLDSHARNCGEIFLGFQEVGVFSASDITYDTLLSEFFSKSKESYYMKAVHNSNMRLVLQYLYDKGLVPFGYTLFVDGMTMRYGYYWNKLSAEEIQELKMKSYQHSTWNLHDFFSICESIYQEHIQTGYSRSYVTGIRRITKLFYLFMDMNQLDYYPDVGIAWLSSIEPYVSVIEYKHARRVLCLIEQRYKGNVFPLENYFHFKETLYEQLPDWCIPEVDMFLSMKEKEGWTASTLAMYKVCVCRFCLAVASMGIISFKELNATVIKQFNLSDQHSTPEGKNAYNSRIRMFLEFLGEVEAVDNPFLFLALPCISAPKEALVVTLTEEEQEILHNIFNTEDASISLRQKAMLQLGLYMGIRGIDIINLTIDDIDWDNTCIRVAQEKTHYEIILPMPTSVANALFRYIMKERPSSDTRKIFVRKVAPFTPVSVTSCTNALRSALPDRDVPGSGFHVTRKTFASNVLKNGTTPQAVAEVLGHRGLGAINRYLSLEENGMRLCGISLSDKNLTLDL